jgi:copper homeostasis protein
MPAPLIEVAVESVAGALAAVRAGAGRLELCADLSHGGVTPSAGMLRAVREATDVPLVVLIRPRPGDFVYTPDELTVMRHDIREARRAGANAVALGALTQDRQVDDSSMRGLIDAAESLEVVMHRAIDQTVDVPQACATLAALHVRRVLTSGGAPSALEGAAVLAMLVHRFEPGLSILAGGKVRAASVKELLHRTMVGAVHLGPRRRVEAAGMGERDELDLEALDATIRAIHESGAHSSGQP